MWDTLGREKERREERGGSGSGELGSVKVWLGGGVDGWLGGACWQGEGG